MVNNCHHLFCQMNLLLKEYILSGDSKEAERCLSDLEVPHFHHEFVYEVNIGLHSEQNLLFQQSKAGVEQAKDESETRCVFYYLNNMCSRKMTTFFMPIHYH